MWRSVDGDGGSLVLGGSLPFVVVPRTQRVSGIGVEARHEAVSFLEHEVAVVVVERRYPPIQEPFLTQHAYEGQRQFLVEEAGQRLPGRSWITRDLQRDYGLTCLMLPAKDREWPILSASRAVVDLDGVADCTVEDAVDRAGIHQGDDPLGPRTKADVEFQCRARQDSSVWARLLFAVAEDLVALRRVQLF